MQPSSSEISIIFIAGSAIMLLVFGFILLFVVLYERKKNKYRMQLQEIEIGNQKKMLEAVITTQEKEKQFFAEELHDSLGQILSTININLNNLEQRIAVRADTESIAHLINETKKLTKSSIQEVRNISQKLLPVVLSDFGLETALKDLCNRINDLNVLKTELHFKPGKVRYPEETEKAIFRISQELINNTLKYAAASHIIIKLYHTSEHIVYDYQDNGKGFNMDSPREKPGLGLKSIESRVSFLNGTLQINSEKNNGIKVSIHIPYHVN